MQGDDVKKNSSSGGDEDEDKDDMGVNIMSVSLLINSSPR